MISKAIKDFIFLPLRILFDHKRVNSWGLTSLYEERINICKKFAQGKVLDIGCGEENEFLTAYGKKGIGVDLFPWQGVDVVCDGMKLPFKSNSFDTVLFIGSFNYFQDKTMILNEAYRVLNPQGVTLITMINPIFCYLRHKLAWWDKEQNITQKGQGGLWPGQIKQLLKSTQFTEIRKIPFLYGLNSLYIGKKK